MIKPIPKDRLTYVFGVVSKEMDEEGTASSALVQALSANIILTTLTEEDRLSFYILVEKGSFDEAKSFVYSKIPDFNEKFSSAFKSYIVKVMESST